MVRRIGRMAVKLVVVLAVAVPMGGLGRPALGRVWVHWQARESAAEIASALKHARARAIERKQTERVVFSERNRSWESDNGFNKLPDGVSLAAPPRDRDGEAAIEFYPDGTSNGGQVVVWAHGAAWSVAVDPPAGAVRRRHAGV